MTTEPRSGAYADATSDATEDESLLPLRDSLRIIRRRLWLILLVAVVFIGASVGFSLLQTPQYEASVKILVGQRQGSVDPSNLQGNVQGLQQLTQTLAEAASTRPLAEAVIRQLDLRITPEDFLKNTRVEQIPNTQFIQISYRDPDPKRARDVADAIGEVFSGQISEVSPDASAVTATVWESATVPDNPASPNPLRDGILALVLGSLVGIGLAFLLEYMDDSLRTPEEAEKASGVPAFGTIPQFEAAPKDSKTGGKGTEVDGFSARLVTVSEPVGIATEAFRTLRTSLLYMATDASPKVIVLTSSGPREGKSTVCANLGVVLAQAGKRTLIIDCDLRRPAMHEIFGLHNSNGLTNVLAEEHSLPEVWQEPLPKLKVVTTGPLPPDPTELLGSGHFAELIDRARQAFDYTLIDSPPIEPVSDPAILAAQGDGVLLVLSAQESRKRSVQQSMHSMDAIGANVLGTVLNNVEATKKGYYGGYPYGYAHT